MWLASLLRIGVLKASFIPEKRIRQIRELVTLRKSYTQSLADYKRRVHKLFETANIKIGSVVSDLFGKTGRNLIETLYYQTRQILCRSRGKISFVKEQREKCKDAQDESQASWF